ncbi:hypothetical protein ACF058_26710 [Streptomyces sp. NPDC015501]|uniref:hypothetical protein n=1 Tax=unclassified Streptomyces TaxID=2593676 RepID=UPI001273433F|nr:hypothetical protein A3L22_26740 [Streptomyces griseus subsp. griseus]
MGKPLPTGFYVVDTERSDDGSFMGESVDDRPGLDLLAHTRLKDFRGRTPRGAGGPRAGVAEGAWFLEALPV